LAGEKLAKLVELMAHLRGPDGCAWDRAQDYDSVKGLLLEEAYEVIDAVNARDFDALEDELGDLLFQVVFYSRLAEEERRFTIDDVVERVHAKLRRRHPHVFGESRAGTAEEALKSWLAVKEKEREQGARASSLQREEKERAGETPALPAIGVPASASLLDGMPRTLPSTLEAYELGVRAAEVGFDWAQAGDVLDKMEEEIRELRNELDGASASAEPAAANQAHVEEEIGDLLFTAAHLARHLRSDPETCLRRANRKFKRRFQKLEDAVARRGKQVRECTPEELDAIWTEVKDFGF
jgi:MazG family protein